MKNVVLIAVTCFLLTLTAYGQCQSGSVCVPQATIDRAAQAADELLQARKVIEGFQTERSASIAERQAAQVLIKGLNDLIAVKDQIGAEKDKVIALYGQVIEMQKGIIERLEKALNAPKSGWQKFLSGLKAVGYILMGIAIRGGL